MEVSWNGGTKPPLSLSLEIETSLRFCLEKHIKVLSRVPSIADFIASLPIQEGSFDDELQKQFRELYKGYKRLSLVVQKTFRSLKLRKQ
jgi:hypothetical protein